MVGAQQLEAYATLDARSDLYALGVVLYEAVTGQLPFAGLFGFELLRAHVEPPQPPRDLRPDLPMELDDASLTYRQSRWQIKIREAQPVTIRDDCP